MSLRRRNSISTSLVFPSHLTLPQSLSASFPVSSAAAMSSSSATTTSSSSSDADIDSIPIKPTPSYTSLKDLISGGGGAANSPTAATPAGSDICIRNHLVKQAAWAYLQPMSTSLESNSDSLLRRIADKVRNSHIVSLLRSAFNWAIRGFWLCFL